jgi:predicted ATPase
VRAWLFSALRELLGNIAREKLVIALIDDLHWADNDSMTLLSELLREPGAPRVLLLCTQRTQAPTSSAKVFGRDVEERTLELANLSQGAAMALVEQLAQQRARTQRSTRPSWRASPEVIRCSCASCSRPRSTGRPPPVRSRSTV